MNVSDGVMGHPRRLILLLLLSMLALSSEAPAAARLEPLTVAYSTFSGAYVPLWIAVEEQLGRKHGLEIKSVYAGRIRPQQLLASGEVPFVVATGTGALSSHILGIDRKSVV